MLRRSRFIKSSVYREFISSEIEKVDAPTKNRKNWRVTYKDGTVRYVKEKPKDVDSDTVKPSDTVKSGYSRDNNNYRQEDVGIESFRTNMSNNLSQFADDSVKELKNQDTSPVDKSNVDKFVSELHRTAGSVVRKYRGILSKHTYDKMSNYVNRFSEVVKSAVEDGSLGDVSQSKLDEFVREDLKRLFHQEVETKQRSLGDHGIRHVLANANNSFMMLDELKKAGLEITGKDKLMAMIIQINHDLGYTVGSPATDAMKGGLHKSNSKKIAQDEISRYQELFGKSDAGKIVEVIGTHDDGKLIDWGKDPVGSSVRLSDCMSLFGQDKVQDLFIRSPEAMQTACKLRLAMNSDDQGVVDKLIKDLHSQVGKLETSEHDKELLHFQINEMAKTKGGLDYTLNDILARYSGRLKNFEFNPTTSTMDIHMVYVPEAQLLDEMFGDKLSAKKFKSFSEDDMSGEPVHGKMGETVFKNPDGKMIAKLSIEGFDESPADASVSEAFRTFEEKTVRPFLTKAAGAIQPPPADKKMQDGRMKDILQKAKGKFTEEEWNALMLALKGKSGEEAAKILMSWPMIQSERDYLLGKIAKRILSSVFTAKEAGDAFQEAIKRYGTGNWKRTDNNFVGRIGGGIIELEFDEALRGVEVEVSVRVKIRDDNIAYMLYDDFNSSFNNVVFRNKNQVLLAGKKAFDWVDWSSRTGWAEKTAPKFSSIASRIAGDFEIVSADEMENYCSSCAQKIREGKLVVTRNELRKVLGNWL